MKIKPKVFYVRFFRVLSNTIKVGILKSQYFGKWQLEALGEISLKEFDDRAAESAEQDQIAHSCSLILIFTPHKVNNWSGTGR